MLQKNSQDMRLQENHGLQNSPWGGGKPYLASGLLYVFSYFPFGFEGRIWNLIVSVPDHCLSFCFGSDSRLSTTRLCLSALTYTTALND